jgi:hypothetical protein
LIKVRLETSHKSDVTFSFCLHSSYFAHFKMKNKLILLFALLPVALGEPLSASCIFDPSEVPVQGFSLLL